MRNVYNDCMAVQDASNFSGVARAFGEAVVDLGEERVWLQGHGINLDLRKHPVTVWWLCKLNEMTANYEAAGTGTHIGSLLSLSYPTLTRLSVTVMQSDAHLDQLRQYVAALAALERGEPAAPDPAPAETKAEVPALYRVRLGWVDDDDDAIVHPLGEIQHYGTRAEAERVAFDQLWDDRIDGPANVDIQALRKEPRPPESAG